LSAPPTCTDTLLGVRRKTGRYALIALAGLTVAALLRQRHRPIPHPPPLTFLFENPVAEAFVGVDLLLERADLTPGMRVLDAGCGPGRLTIPLAKAVGVHGEVVALDGQSAMLRKLEERIVAESLRNVRLLRAGLDEGALEQGVFDRAILTMVLGEVRDREAALHEVFGALRPGGLLCVTEVFGDPDYRRSTTVRREVEKAGFRFVSRHGGFPAFTLSFEKPESLAAEQPPPEALSL